MVSAPAALASHETSTASAPTSAPAMSQPSLRLSTPITIREISPTIAQSTLPTQLWNGRWQAQQSSGVITFEDSLSELVFAQAVEETDSPDLLIAGVSVDELAQGLVKEIAIALKDGDFTKILSPDREFTM